jgi:hypothetical protein
MTWIKTRKIDDPSLAQVLSCMDGYPEEYSTPVPAVSDGTDDGAKIVLAHSLTPKVLHHSFAAFAEMMSPELPLSRRDHEMIAATVSSLNDCFY